MPVEAPFKSNYRIHERIGRLRVVFRFEKRPTVPDAMGELRSQTWTKAFDTRGMIEPVRGNQFVEGKGLRTEMLHKITIRFRAGIDATMRIVRISDSQIFNIRSISDAEDKHRWLHITCQETPVGTT